MPETRMLPKKTPRSTGIERTNVQGGTRQQAAGTGSSSHVSAAPGAGARVHEHVLKARNPAAAQPAQGGGANVSGGRQDAKVQLIDRRNGGAAGFDRPTVQLMDAAQAAQLTRPGSRASSTNGAQGFDARGAFSADQLTLIGSLLGQYKERLEAIPGGSNKGTIATCGDALERIAYLLKGGTFAPSAPISTAVDGQHHGRNGHTNQSRPAASQLTEGEEASDSPNSSSDDPDGQG